MEDWFGRWREGRTGWHEADGNEGLHTWWPDATGRVLVPLCGKSPDLKWLADRGHEVVGVELSAIAAEAFFAEQGLKYHVEKRGGFDVYSARDDAVEFFCGDYFAFQAEPFDALYDRGALVALPESLRSEYVKHTKTLLAPTATRLVITLEYEQRIVDGPPYAVWPDELLDYWDDLVRVEEKDDIENCPPKFRKAGLTEISEVFWLAKGDSDPNSVKGVTSTR